jgi:hypothetical protein
VLDKGGTELTIALEERSRRNENPPPKKDASWWTSFDKYSFEPTGDLEIILGRCLVQQAQVKRAQEDELRRQRAREAEEQRRIEIEEQRRRQTLADNAADWNNAEQLRRFISVVEIVLQGEPALAPRQIDKWIEWAKKCADRTDPITNGKLVQQVEVLGRTS